MSLSSLDKISELLHRPFFTAKEARAKGVHPSSLAYHCNKGILERISRGIYRAANSQPDVPVEWEDVALTISSIPNGVLCLVTALTYFNLTDEIPRQIWVAVPRDTRPPTRNNTKVIRMSNTDLGIMDVTMGEFAVKMFNEERTIVDSFRYLSKEIAIKALRRYLTTTPSRKPDLKKLTAYAKELRTDISSYVETITT